jgi:hypothetical protein
MSDYDQRIHAALIELGGKGSASDIARKMGRYARWMHASLQAATARVSWLTYDGSLWHLTDGAGA